MYVRRIVLMTIGVVGLAASSGCGGGTGALEVVRGEGGGPVGSIVIGPAIQFVSGHNGSTNPAVDTIPVGATVTWSWSGALPHSVQSIGTPSFTSSGIFNASRTYARTFTAPGTYRYECAVHGPQMSGTLVVQ